ncbi:MAG: hypothetical protein IT447_16875 [Phycisphaerales bacterium]|nr:hypothetical protein [Phycisphaerales bacterium]
MAMKVPGVIKPTVEIDDRLVKECHDLQDVQNWQVQGEKKRREEMRESPLTEEHVLATWEQKVPLSRKRAPVADQIFGPVHILT